MAYDIYGNVLRPGYCEVHPDVHEQWPCSVCIEQQVVAAERDAYYAASEKEKK